jgi:hypothetical protein
MEIAVCKASNFRIFGMGGIGSSSKCVLSADIGVRLSLLHVQLAVVIH